MNFLVFGVEIANLEAFGAGGAIIQDVLMRNFFLSMRTFAQFRAVLVLALAMGSLPAVALPVTDYNLFLLEDLNSKSVHVHGKTFVGGDINAQGQLEFGTQMD